MPKTIHIAIGTQGQILHEQPGSTRETLAAVTDVPDDLSSARVLDQIEHLTFYPWPKTIRWPGIAEMDRGSIVLTRKRTDLATLV